MKTEALTVSETIVQIQEALRDYIEATYHVGHPALVRRRRRLLEQPAFFTSRRTSRALRDTRRAPSSAT